MPAGSALGPRVPAGSARRLRMSADGARRLRMSADESPDLGHAHARIGRGAPRESHRLRSKRCGTRTRAAFDASIA